MKKPLIIYGAGGLGREILTLVFLLPEWEVVGFLDDNVPKGSMIKNIPVLGGLEALDSMEKIPHIILAIADTKIKRKLANQLDTYQVQFPILIHPSVVLQEPATIKLGIGCVLCAGTILTNDISIGDHTLINLNTTIGHDSSIGNYSSVMCGVNIAGEVNACPLVYIGSGANVLNKVFLGEASTVGMGAVVLENVQPFKTVVGVPAKEI